MNEQAFTLEKLDISLKDWDITYEDNNCSYSFSTPADGVLLLTSVGKICSDVLRKQTDFIENYHIQLNRRIVNYRSVVVWDVSGLNRLKDVDNVSRVLHNLSVDIVILVPGKLVFKLYFRYWKNKALHYQNILSNNRNEAVAFAKRIKSMPDASDLFKGRFADLWSVTKKTKKIGKRVFRYLELPDWQHENVEKTFRVRVLFFENRTILYEMNGAIGADDVQLMQQKVVSISNQLEIDLKEFGFYVIFDMRNVKSIDPEARRLLRRMEQHQHHLSKGVVVLANPLVKYLLSFRKRLFPKRYDHWNTAKTISEAFSTIETRSILVVEKHHLTANVEEPAKDYNHLKNQFEKLQTEHQILVNNYNRSLSGIRRVLSYVNTGEFITTPFKPRYNDDSIEGEVYNSFALLHNDLQRNSAPTSSSHYRLEMSYTNIDSIINAVSIPALVFSNKRIAFVNKALSEFTGIAVSQLKNQPLGSFVHTYELNRVERYLEETAGVSSFECDIYNDQDRTITVTMRPEYISIDGIYAHLIFIENNDKTSRPAALFTADAQHKLPENIVVRSLSGVNYFYFVMLGSINQKFFNQFASPDGYDPQEGARMLISLTGFVRRIMTGVSAYQIEPERADMFVLKESIDRITVLFTDYIMISRPGISFRLIGILSLQKVGLQLHSFWIEAILVRLLHLFCDISGGSEISLICKYKSDDKIEIAISDDGPNMNLYSLNKSANHDTNAISVAEIDQLLKQFNCKLLLESTLDKGNIIAITIPIVDKGIGYEGALMDLSFHNILVFDEVKEFDSYKIALNNTGANLYQAYQLQDALNALSEKAFSIIFLNMDFSEADISLFVSRVKNDYARIPIIGLTQDSTHNSWKKNTHFGIDVFLSKPLDSEIMKEKIKMFL
jgi:CheY-like chemotaxis protein/PAS domain-containing protein